MKRTDNATFLDKNGIERFRQPVLCFTRTMWYIRSMFIPNNSIKWWDIVNDSNRDIKVVSNWYNLWKMSEHLSRKNFKEWKSCPRNFDSESQRINAMLQDNQDFISKYMIHETTICTKN